jgi:hypothetical protein
MHHGLWHYKDPATWQIQSSHCTPIREILNIIDIHTVLLPACKILSILAFTVKELVGNNIDSDMLAQTCF